MKLTAKHINDVAAFADAISTPLYPWQREAFGEACKRVGGRFKYRVAGVSVPRGDGKSWAAAMVGLWMLLCGKPGTDILGVALDVEGAKVILHHAQTVLRDNPALAAGVKATVDGLSVPATGNRWSIKSSEHTASRGRHPGLVLYDETGWAKDDELFSSLLAGQASVADPLMLIVSTVGRKQSGPLWNVKMLAEGGDPTAYWYWAGKNQSPKVTGEFLERQRKILVPAQYAREHENQWIGGADAFLSAEDVDVAMGQGWRPQDTGEARYGYHAYLDVGVVHDPSVIAVAHRDEDGKVVLDALHTFQGSTRQPVRIETLEKALLELSVRFNLEYVRVESWQGVAVVERLEKTGLPVELLNVTPKSTANEWGLLAQQFAAGNLVLFPHADLRAELLNLTVEVTAAGARVVDRGKVHQDHAVALRGVVTSLFEVQGGTIHATTRKAMWDCDVTTYQAEIDARQRREDVLLMHGDTGDEWAARRRPW